MTKLQWDYIAEPTGADFEKDYILYKQKPSYWKYIPTFVQGLKTPLEIAKGIFSNRALSNYSTFRTAKSCPGFIDYFKYTIPIKFTCDIMLETYRDGSFECKVYDDSMKLNIHLPEQINGHISSDNIIIKFCYNVCLYSKNNHISFHTPILYNPMPYEVCPGLLTEKYTPVNLNIITLFPRIDKTYYFKAGQIVAIAQFEKPIAKIEKMKIKESFIRKLYLTGRSIDPIINLKNE